MGRQSRPNIKHKWATPFFALEYLFEWFAYFLSNWTFLHVVNYLRTFGILVAVIFYFSESGDRLKQKHYQAWQVINTAQGKGGNGGRIDALQELNEDKVPLVGVDVSGAFLAGPAPRKSQPRPRNLERRRRAQRRLCRPSISATQTCAPPISATAVAVALRSATPLSMTPTFPAPISARADFTGATLSNTDLRNANLQSVDWQHIATIKSANIAGIKNAPEGFIAWALKNGAVQNSSSPQ